MWECVDDGWFKQSHLTQGRLIGLLGWVRLHTCCTLINVHRLNQPSPHALGREVYLSFFYMSILHSTSVTYFGLVQTTDCKGWI